MGTEADEEEDSIADLVKMAIAAAGKVVVGAGSGKARGSTEKRSWGAVSPKSGLGM
jgi:hypothetical protein